VESVESVESVKRSGGWVMRVSGVGVEEYGRAAEVWEASVRATHDFVTEADLDVFRPLVAGSFGEIAQLAGLWDGDDRLVGFVGVEHGKVEMLFLDPEVRGQGGGKMLLEHAIEVFGASTLDVNEQNPHAVGFYLHHGFRVIGRSELDSTGRPYPLLHLTLSPTA
jgi:putative acetyltransferase